MDAVALIPKEEIKTEPQELAFNPTIKAEPYSPSLNERVVNTERNPEDNSWAPEVKTERGDVSKTHQVKSEPSTEFERKQQLVKCELFGAIAPASDLMIESTSSLIVYGPTEDENSLNVGGIVQTQSRINVEFVGADAKEEVTDINLETNNDEAWVENDYESCDMAKPVTIATGQPQGTFKCTDNALFGDSGRDGNFQQLSRDRLESIPNGFCVNPKSAGRIQEEVCKSLDGGSVEDNRKVEMERLTEGNLGVFKVEGLSEYPPVWVNVKKEEQDEAEYATDVDDEVTDEERTMVEDPDWHLDGISDGIHLVRNINQMLSSRSMETEEIDLMEPRRGMRGRPKKRLLEHDELVKELLDGQALSSGQAELLELLRSRMNFSDPTSLSYFDGLKCHMCLVCAYKTHIFAHMVKHLRRHTGEKPFVCPDCDYRCAESSSLATHRRTHTGEKPHACPHCDYRTNSTSILKTHIMIHTGKKPLSCPYCDFKCREHGGLKRHIRTHTGEKPFACPHCEYRGPSSTCLKSHLMVHTKEKPHVCRFCEYATACSSSLTIHLRRHTGEKPYTCPACDSKFVTSGTLKVHMRTHTGEKPYMCKICGYRCATQGRFKSHMRIHTGDKKHECPFCDYKSVRSDNLKMHLRTHSGERPYPCPHCEYRSSEKARLIQHIRIHTGEKPYVCNVCEFRTSDRNGLRSHSSIHSTDKPFCCSFCDFKTARRGILRTHIMIHTGARPYACPYCPYRCTKSCSLKGHVANNHGGIKKFPCEVEGCSYRAVIASGLKTHMKTHARKKQVNHLVKRPTPDSTKYACYNCPFKTSSRQKMKTHASQHLHPVGTD